LHGLVKRVGHANCLASIASPIIKQDPDQWIIRQYLNTKIVVNHSIPLDALEGQTVGDLFSFVNCHKADRPTHFDDCARQSIIHFTEVFENVSDA